MNYRMLVYVMGRILRAEGLLMIFPFIISLVYGEKSGFAFAVVIISLLLISTIISTNPPEKSFMRPKDGFAAVGIAWLLLSFFGCLPFYISGQIPSFIDAFFETVSGFTTTGSSILTEVESLDRGMTFWRSFTNWIGGMGILVFVLAILPQSDMKSTRMMHIMRAESPGPNVGKLVPKLKQTATIMYTIYIVLTTTEFILLLVGGMPFFDSLCHSFATAGTGGFSIKNAGIAAYGSPYIEIVITVFMILFSVNFNIFYLIITGNILRAIKSEELWAFLGIIAFSIATITINVSSMYESIGDAIRDSAFSVATVISTTGFATADFDKWPLFSQVILVLLMFIGGCAGSTCGGLKISRLILLIKNGLREIKYIFQPNSVYSIRFEGKPVEKDTVRSVANYFFIYITLFTVFLVAISALESVDPITAFTSVAATFNNIGPGLRIVGPTGNYADFCPLSKFIFSLAMLTGRLELFPIITLFAPSTWKKV